MIVSSGDDLNIGQHFPSMRILPTSFEIWGLDGWDGYEIIECYSSSVNLHDSFFIYLD